MSNPVSKAGEGEDPTIEEIADGMALWEEHRPQTPEDWIGVARRTNADGGPDASATVLFKALCLAVWGPDDNE